MAEDGGAASWMTNLLAGLCICTGWTRPRAPATEAAASITATRRDSGAQLVTTVGQTRVVLTLQGEADNRALVQKLVAARANTRFLDPRLADLEDRRHVDETLRGPAEVL